MNAVNQSIEDIAGYSVCTQSVSACVSDVVTWIQQASHEQQCRLLACINPHSYVVSLNDPAFAQALHTADWLLPDGVGIVYASKLLGGQIRERVTGNDIFHGVQSALNRLGGYRVFFLGSTEAELADISKRMARDYPHIQIAGMYSPPFTPKFSAADNQAMIAAINAAAPDVLWVGMTAPKQEKWLCQNIAKLNVKFAAGVGSVFDFYSGTVKRSPLIFQRLGLEWLPRLLRHPRRVWRRMFISAPIFVLHIMRRAVGLS